jgi:hypothetical protein
MKAIFSAIESICYLVLIATIAALLFFLIWKATSYVANYFFKDKSHEIKCRWRIVFFIQIIFFLVLIDCSIGYKSYYKDLSRCQPLFVIFFISNVSLFVLFYWVVLGYIHMEVQNAGFMSSSI